MPNLRPGVTANLHSINRVLSAKYNKPLSISDTITYLTLYYSKHEKLEIELNQGNWEITEINGDGNETNKSK